MPNLAPITCIESASPSYSTGTVQRPAKRPDSRPRMKWRGRAPILTRACGHSPTEAKDSLGAGITGASRNACIAATASKSLAQASPLAASLPARRTRAAYRWTSSSIVSLRAGAVLRHRCGERCPNSETARQERLNASYQPVPASGFPACRLQSEISRTLSCNDIH